MHLLSLYYQSYSYILSRGTSSINTTKIYIGYLPVSMNDAVLREAFEKHCEVSEVMYFIGYFVVLKKGMRKDILRSFVMGSLL